MPTAAETLAAAFVRAAARELDERQIMAAVNFGMTMLLRDLPLRYLVFEASDPMLSWWVGPILPGAARELPYLRQEPGCVWVLACEGYQCVGFACMEVTRQNLAHLRHDFVQKDRRRQGIGTELMRQRLALGHARTVNGYHATVNKASLPLYLRAGFREAGKRGSYIQVVRGPDAD